MTYFFLHLQKSCAFYAQKLSSPERKDELAECKLALPNHGRFTASA
jgi:hypothetical protein